MTYYLIQRGMMCPIKQPPIERPSCHGGKSRDFRRPSVDDHLGNKLLLPRFRGPHPTKIVIAGNHDLLLDSARDDVSHQTASERTQRASPYILISGILKGPVAMAARVGTSVDPQLTTIWVHHLLILTY
jgi:hypothetical protein